MGERIATDLLKFTILSYYDALQIITMEEYDS